MNGAELKHRLRHGLRARIVLLTLAGALAPAGVLAGLSWTGIRSFERQISNERQQIAAGVAASAAARVQTEMERLNQVAAALGGRQPPSRRARQAILREAYLRSRLFDRVLLTGGQRQAPLYAPAARPSPAAAFPAAIPAAAQALGSGLPVISPLVTLPDGRRRLYFFVPWRSWRGSASGLVAGEIAPASRRFRSLLGIAHAAPGETIDLVSREGTVLASTDPRRLYASSDHRHFIGGLIRGQRASTGTCHTCHGGAVPQRVQELMAFAPVSPLAPWGISLHQPVALAFQPAIELQKQMLFWLPLVMLLTLLFALGAASSITSPLALLTRRARRMRAGELETPIPHLGSDEVGELGEALERMRLDLKRSMEQAEQARNELETRVEARTREIGQLNRELRAREALRAQLLQKVIVAQEEERRRIARELHDETAQVASVLAAGLDRAGHALPPGAARAALEQAQNLAQRIIAGIHRLAFDLRPSVLDDLGLFPAIRWYAMRDLAPRGVEVHCEFDESDERRLPLEVETSLFRAAQEAISNIARHAQAETVLIQCMRGAGAVTIEIEDDGRGFDLPSAGLSDGGRGLGLAGIRERLDLLGGRAEIESAPGEGTRLLLSAPLGDSHE